MLYTNVYIYICLNIFIHLHPYMKKDTKPRKSTSAQEKKQLLPSQIFLSCLFFEKIRYLLQNRGIQTFGGICEFFPHLFLLNRGIGASMSLILILALMWTSSCMTAMLWMPRSWRHFFFVHCFFVGRVGSLIMKYTPSKSKEFRVRKRWLRLDQARLQVGNFYSVFLPNNCWNVSFFLNKNPKFESQQEKWESSQNCSTR